MRMIKLIFAALFGLALLTLSGCATLIELTGQTAEVMADLKEKYCAETNDSVRAKIRAEYNAIMDERGLPHDQVNCPEDTGGS